MYTQCPLCDTQYRISAAELKAALGKVRCAQCQSVFNALSHLTDTPPEIPTLTKSVAAPAADIAAELEDEAPTLLAPETLTPFDPHIEPDAADEHILEITDALPALALTKAAADSLADDTVFEEWAAAPTSAPPSRLIIPEMVGASARLMADEFAYPRKKPYSGLGTALWSGGIILLLALLATQYVYAMRNDLARTAEFRPLLEQLCAAVKNFARCEIPLQRDLTLIDMQERNIHPHPRFQNTLLVSVTLLNKAAFRQAYPSIELTLTDFNGALISRRRFQPADYLITDVDITQGLAPQGVAQVALEIVTPKAPLNLDLTSWDFVLF